MSNPEFLLVQSCARYSAEATWGVVNPSPTWVDMPIASDGLDLTRPKIQAEAAISDYRVRYDEQPHKIVEGPINTWLFPTKAESLLDIGLSRDSSGELTSYTWEVNDEGNVDEKRQLLGSICDTLAISSEAEGAWITLGYTFVGSNLVTAAKFTPGTLPPDNPYIFQHGSFTLDGTADTKIESFTINIANNLQRGPVGSGNIITYLKAGIQNITGTFTVPYQDDDIRDLMIAGSSAGSFDVTFTHTKSGSPSSTVRLNIRELRYTAVPIVGGPGEVRKLNVTFDANWDATNPILDYTVTGPTS